MSAQSAENVFLAHTMSRIRLMMNNKTKKARTKAMLTMSEKKQVLKKEKSRFIISVAEELHDKIKNEAIENGITVNHLLHDMIKAYFQKKEQK
jgi:predicted HicB family RNase H-like nuclease